ncbi:hypothetical protein OVN20_01530 [Microcella daejeonensis]|uniref:hypothetical protein n=1 Tax=Microcella daejeonensis TaxID=2994971 RepID=UPI00226E0F1C|nr:hypothetical protein [Microcella daejeonensis]WAB84284.1 hypothetical protein OVN20_01530 [Microcella daejeonensis]
MSTVRHPVGPQPPQVYWRRRLIVGLGLLAVIVIIVLIIVRPGSGDPEPTAASPAPSETAAPEASEEPAADAPAEPPADPTACTPDQVEVVAVTDADAYGAEQLPLLSLTIRNLTSTACTMEAGTDVQEYVITSGADRIWSSKDCQTDPVAAPITLESEQELSTSPLQWSRTRSEAGVCDVQREPVRAGGATYRLSVSVGGFASSTDKAFLLN